MKMKFSIMPSRAVSDPKLQPNVVRTLSALCCYTSANGICYPNQNTLGDLIGVSRALVSRNIGILRNYGYIIDLEPLGKKHPCLTPILRQPHAYIYTCFDEYRIKPETGKLLIFSNSVYEHSVSKIEGGERFALSLWYNQ